MPEARPGVHLHLEWHIVDEIWNLVGLIVDIERKVCWNDGVCGNSNLILAQILRDDGDLLFMCAALLLQFYALSLSSTEEELLVCCHLWRHRLGVCEEGV